MAAVRNVPGSGYGSAYVDSLVWGGAAWDPASGPIKVWFGQSADLDAAFALRGESEYLQHDSQTFDWNLNEIQAFSYAAGLYQSVCGLSFVKAASVDDADIVWWKTLLPEGDLGVHETPADGQIWGYFNPTTASWSNMYFGATGSTPCSTSSGTAWPWLIRTTAEMQAARHFPESFTTIRPRPAPTA